MRFVTFARIPIRMSRKFKYIIVALGVFTSGFFGCKQQDVFAPPTILVNPSELTQNVKPGDTINFSANLEAEAGIQKFEITESIDGGAPRKIYDSSVTGTLANLEFTYYMPATKQIGERRLVFEVTDTEGNVGNTARSLVIEGIDSLLSEETGLMIYSEKSGKFNGYLIQTNVLTSPDSTFLDDIDILCTDTTDTLSRTIISPIGNEFVQFNSYNYDSATFRSMVDAYELGTPRKTLSNIKSGDIFITKLASPALYEYAIIKINSITDDTGAENDRYVFSVKK